MEPSEVSNLREGDPEEHELILRCQHGEVEVFDELVLRHQRQAFAVALRLLGDVHEAEEVAQEAFIRAYRAIKQFRADSKFSTWLLSIVTNLCRNRRRWWARRRRVIATSLDVTVETEEGMAVHEVADPTPSPSIQALRHELSQQVITALGELDTSSRAVVVLRDLEGLSYEEIAQVLGCQIGTVKSRLNRARLRLRALLDGKI